MLGQRDKQRSGTGTSQTSPQISSLIVVVKDEFTYNNKFFLHQSSVCYAQFPKSESWKKLNRFDEFVDTGDTFHDTNFTILYVARSSYQSILPCALHSETSSCVWMSNSNKSRFLHQRDLELWDDHDLPSFPRTFLCGIYLFNVWQLQLVQLFRTKFWNCKCKMIKYQFWN